MSVLLLRRRATRPIQSIPSLRFPPSLTALRTTTSTANPPPARRALGTFATISLLSAFSLGAYTLGAIYPPPPLSLLYPRPAPPPPADPISPASLEYTAALEATLQSLPALTALRTAPDAADWYETRPHAALPDSARTHKLTIGALRGPGRLALFPLARVRKDESAAVVFVHLGRGLCGHDGIVHGGLLATLLDEALGRNAITNFPEKVGVTATLSLKYKAPTRADQFVVMKTHLVSVDGRKARVAGRVETLDGTLLVEAEALFIQPRYSKLLNTATIRQQIGGPPPPEPVLVEGGADTVVPK